MEEVPHDEVLMGVEGRVGLITLNRPRALNALTLGMVRSIDGALRAWAADDAVGAVVVRGAGERGLCAGGDMRAVREAAAAGDPLPQMFWAQEYRLDARLARYPKPVVALMDGIVMGGGIGLSAHVGIRVATERLVAAMPEVGIGFFPDVGGTYLLSRAPGELGTHLALTGSHVGAADAVACDLADVVVEAAALPRVVAELVALDDPSAAAITALLAPRAIDPGPSPLAAQASWIDRCYAGDEAEAIVAALRADGGPEAAAAADAITAASPTSIKVTLRALREAATLRSLEACLVADHRIACAMLAGADLSEGNRAVLVDKDRAPRWDPPHLADVGHAAVQRHFDAPAQALALAAPAGVG